MFELCFNEDEKSISLECQHDILLKVFDSCRVLLPEEALAINGPPPGFEDIVFEIIMDSTGKKFGESLIPMPQFLVNNPNISIIPARSNQNIPSKQSPTSIINRVSRAVPVSLEYINNQDQSTIKVNDFKETINSFKRTAPHQISDRPIKLPKHSITKFSKSYKEKKIDSIKSIVDKSHKQTQLSTKLMKIIDPPTKVTCTTSSSTLTSSSIITVPQDSTTQTPTKPPINTDHTNIDVDKDHYMLDGLKFNYVNNKKDSPNSKVLEIICNGKKFEVPNPEIKNAIFLAANKIINQRFTKEELEIQLSSGKLTILKSSEPDRSSEINSSSVNSKLSTTNHNITSSLKNQCTSQVILKSPSIDNQQQQQQSTSKQITTIIIPDTPKQTTSSNASLKIQSNVKQNDLKQVTNNQNVTLIKHPMATVPQIQSVNKQIISNQPSKSSKPVLSVTQIPLVTKQLLNVPQSIGKTTITSQPVPIIKRCSKCNAISEDNVCPTCRVSTQLKCITVTRIETPCIQLDKSNDNDNHDIQVILSSDDDGDDDDEYNKKKSRGIEPVINQVEPNDLVNKHFQKIKQNPKLLEDKLWQKDLGVKDFFKFEHCHTVRIGSFNTSPVPSGDIFICLHGIRMTIKDADLKPVTIDIQIDNIVKILGYYGEAQPIIFIYTNYMAAVGIQWLLNMDDIKVKYYYNPLSEDSTIKKIQWSFDIKESDIPHLEKLLTKLPKGKYGSLTMNQAYDIINDVFNKNTSPFKFSKKAYENLVLCIETAADYSAKHVIRLSDYRVLGNDEFVNDNVIEFYLNYCYKRKLSDDTRRRTYLFNSFFYTSLSKKVPGKSHTSKSRHERVKKWTKNVNIFEKDFVVIPVNESYHWFLVVICYPNLMGPVDMETGKPATGPTEDTNYYDRTETLYCEPSLASTVDEADGNLENLHYYDFSGHYNESVNYEVDVENLKKKNRRPIKRPCFLVFDSLSGGVVRSRIISTLRSWLFEEFKAKNNGAERDFSPNVMKASLVKVPQQPNFTDCGLYVMHYFEKFFSCPIVDYHLPILHLENWFSPADVTKDCQKRKEVSEVILYLAEKQKVLPKGVTLPVLNFKPKDKSRSNLQSSNSTQQHRPSIIQTLSTRNHNYNNHNKMVDDYDEDMDDDDDDDDNDDGGDDLDDDGDDDCDGDDNCNVDDEEVMVSDDEVLEDAGEMMMDDDGEGLEDDIDEEGYPYRPHSGNMEIGYSQFASSGFYDMGVDGWQGEYSQSENNYESENQFHHADNENMVDINDHHSSTINHNNHHNLDLRQYRHQHISHLNYDDDVLEDYNEEDNILEQEDDNMPSQSSSQSKGHVQHFNRHRL